jgi:6-phosphogluconolactonase
MTTSANEKIQVYPADHFLLAAARLFADLARKAVAERGLFTVALSGGSTPRKLYWLLAENTTGEFSLPWDKIHFFFGDERHVGPEDPESNFRMANESLLSRAASIPGSNIHRIHAENPDAAQAAADYESELRGFFETNQLLRDGFPRFDLVLLGMGADGHTASLFPHTVALEEKTRWVVSNWVEKFKTNRITLTYPVLNRAAVVALLIAGADKAPMVNEVLVQYRDNPRYPVQFVRPIDGIKIWLLDEPAAD